MTPRLNFLPCLQIGRLHWLFQSHGPVGRKHQEKDRIIWQACRRSCHNKCIGTRYADGDLNKGESVCIDRCVVKFSEVQKKVQDKLQAKAQANANLGGGAGGAGGFGTFWLRTVCEVGGWWRCYSFRSYTRLYCTHLKLLGCSCKLCKYTVFEQILITLHHIFSTTLMNVIQTLSNIQFSISKDVYPFSSSLSVSSLASESNSPQTISLLCDKSASDGWAPTRGARREKSP